MMTTATSKSIMLLLLPLLGLVADTNCIAGQAYCTHPTVPEGQPSVMTFHFGRDIDKDSDGFFIYLRRNAEPGADILRCDRQNPVSQVQCKSKNVHFKVGNLTSNSISMLIQDTNKELQDNYTLQSYENSSPLPAIVCTLTVMDARHTSSPSPDIQSDDEDHAWVAAPVIIVLVLLVGAGIVYFLIKRKGRCIPGDASADNAKKEPLLRWWRKNREVDSYKRKRWFFDNFTEEDKTKLLESDKKEEGSFLVTVGSTNPDHFLLVVYFDGELRRFPISRTNNGFKFLGTDKSFGTLTETVKHYTTHKIKDEDKDWGTLSKPFKKEPAEEWYFGKFSREDENKLLQTAVHEPGSFLVRDGITEPSAYVLAVLFKDKMTHFTLVEKEDGFLFRDTGRFFITLTELVNTYTQNDDIAVGRTVYGRLTSPFKKDQVDEWYLESFTAGDDNKFLQSNRKEPGTFLITVGSTNRNHYILAVYFAEKINHFTIIPEENGFTFRGTDKVFRRLVDLVDYYKEQEIVVDGKGYGKLLEPFVK